MKSTLSKRKKVCFSLAAFILFFSLINLIAWFLNSSDSVFWQNPLMVMYPVDQFDQNITIEKYNFNKDPNRPVRYVPDTNRWSIVRLEAARNTGYHNHHLRHRTSRPFRQVDGA